MFFFFFYSYWNTATLSCQACTGVSYANYNFGASNTYDPYSCTAPATVYATYGQTCSASTLCDTTKSLVCSTGSGTGCNCPYNLGGGVCDCPTSNYWNGSSCGLIYSHFQFFE